MIVGFVRLLAGVVHQTGHHIVHQLTTRMLRIEKWFGRRTHLCPLLKFAERCSHPARQLLNANDLWRAIHVAVSWATSTDSRHFSHWKHVTVRNSIQVSE